jgi:hypothetical protein
LIPQQFLSHLAAIRGRQGRVTTVSTGNSGKALFFNVNIFIRCKARRGAFAPNSDTLYTREHHEENT